ncbi:hypothetical protein TKK_0010355 [Trichogramma kaykai]
MKLASDADSPGRRLRASSSSSSMRAAQRAKSPGTLALFAVGLLLFVDCCFQTSEAKVSDQRRCYDPDCSVAVSYGKTTIPYPSKDPDVLSFPANVEVKVFSKEAGSRLDLWGVEINGKRGYAPSRFIRETKILYTDLDKLVPIEESYDVQSKDNTKQAEEQIENNNNIFNTLQESFNEEEIPKDELNENIQISQENDISSDEQLIEENNDQAHNSQKVKESTSDENVKMEIYPDIIKSTFSAFSGLSGILNGDDDESEEDETKEEFKVENDTQSKEADQITLNNNPDLSVDTTTESENVLDKNSDEPVPPESLTSETPIETIEEADLKNTFEKVAELIKPLESAEKNPTYISEEVSEQKNVDDVNDEFNSSEIIEEDKNLNFSIDSIKVESSEHEFLPKSNINLSADHNDHVEEILEVPVVNSENIEVLPLYDEKSTDLNVSNNSNNIISEPQSNDIKSDESINASINSEKIEDFAELTVTDEQKVNTLQQEPVIPVDTLPESFSTDDSVILQVPLEKEIEDEAVIQSNQDFLSLSNNHESLPQYENFPTENNVQTVENLTASNVLTLKSNVTNDTSSLNILNENDSLIDSSEVNYQSIESNIENNIPQKFNVLHSNRNLLNAESIGSEELVIDNVASNSPQTPPASVLITEEDEKVHSIFSGIKETAMTPETCDQIDSKFVLEESSHQFFYICITAVTTLLFSLGYYLIENKRRDAHLISKINKLEKDLMVTKKECIILDENFKSTKTKLDSIENESFGSNEMVLSLKADLATSENVRGELEEQIASLERELETATDTGLELERMLREMLSSQKDENNPLAKKIEDLQVKLNEQQSANEYLTNALATTTQENESLSTDLTENLKKVEELQTELTSVAEELKIQRSTNEDMEQTLSTKIQNLEIQINTLSDEKSIIRKQLRAKELEVAELLKVVEQLNSSNIDLEKLYDVSQVKVELSHLHEERDELKAKLIEEEGARQLLEEHMKVISEEVISLKDQYKIAEKEKSDAETRLEVLTKFFEDKENQRQKEEALWMEKQGEHKSTVERIHSMEKDLHSYRKQIEMLKVEILDQEREYKSQISVAEQKAHENWLLARQYERRLEDSKAESSQLRNRLTHVEKNMNDSDADIKLHRLQQNGENSSGNLVDPVSPLMFAGGVGMPPPPLPPFGPPGFAPPPPFMPPPDMAAPNSRPPPLGGGRLSSPPPHNSSGANTRSPPPPMSPPPIYHGLPPPPHHPHHMPPLSSRFHPPPMMFDVPPPPPPTLGHYPPPAHHSWEDDRRSGGGAGASGFQRMRNYKGSLHSSGESLDKSHQGKV